MSRAVLLAAPLRSRWPPRAGPGQAHDQRGRRRQHEAGLRGDRGRIPEGPNPGVEVSATYGASGTFLAQIANGAPFDLFLSADAEFPAKAVEKGLADGAAFPYAYGRLVVWVPRGTLPDLEKQGLAALAAPSVQKIAIANPDVAPYGRAARAALERAGLLDSVKDRLVMGQNVSQAAQFVESGNAQAAFLPLSLTRVPRSPRRAGPGPCRPSCTIGSSRPVSS